MVIYQMVISFFLEKIMIGERLKIYCEKSGVSNYKLAKEAGVAPTVIHHVVSGRNEPSGVLLVKIITAFPELNGDWLLTGRGEMLLKVASGS